MKVKLEITNCLDCPKSKAFQDPSSDDSWDFHDESLGCTLTKGEGRKNRWNVDGLRIIAGPDRSVRRADCDVPKWCPLAKPKAERPVPAPREDR